MNRVDFTVTIKDDLWPKLTVIVNRKTAEGIPVTTILHETFDTAYTQFENALHNHLRPAVEEIIKRRKGQR